MGREQKVETQNNPLKSMSFLAWRVSKAKEMQQRKEINRSLFGRDRQRGATQH
ncbi:MAG: hypothetical protein H6853_08645 [Rhodospirillales bacterium]|nr:hypothetical protein [Alphaproteobacteria bacterium]USO03573.1 MAG: hypothetical protein H6853_08645 [Rhodospirillales bacterium]